jgi:solute carrier family 25 iron transporter 28/37
MKIWTGASKSGHHPAQAAICGASAAIGHDMFMTPFDTIKQRMQLGHYRGMIDCIHSIFVKEGMRAFYMSLPTTLVMNIPYGSIMMPINESARKLLNPTGAYRLDISMLSGGIAGATAALLTTPLDVIKTRLQTQDLQPCPALANSSKIFNSIGSAANVSGILGAATPAVREGLKYASMADVFNRILAEEGFRGFFRGALLRMLVHAPSVAISWTAYDTAKKILSQVT